MSYGAALYIGCWSCTNYGAARAAPAVWLSPPMSKTPSYTDIFLISQYVVLLNIVSIQNFKFEIDA